MNPQRLTIYRNKRRRDSGTIKNLKDELQESLDEVSVHVDALLDEWLMGAEDGKASLGNT